MGSQTSTYDFYTALPLQRESLVELYSDASLFTPLPENWGVLVADVKDSTAAVSNDQHNQVNLAATGCIVAVLNSLKTSGSEKVPYFFGGDGATFLIPEEYKIQLIEVLERQRDHVKTQWGLELIIGYVAMFDLYKENAQIRISKIQLNQFLQIPVVLGTGMKRAEKLVKNSFSPSTNSTVTRALPDLNGLECRWDKIEPPKSDKTVVCLLVYCDDEAKQRTVYLQVLKELTLIFGELEERQPISAPKLKLNASFEKIKNEVIATTASIRYRTILKKIFETYIGKLYFKYSKAGRNYLGMMKDLSETVMLDGLINTILSGTSTQTNRLIDFLDRLENKGELVYGLHITDSSVMSCYVEDRKSKHAHFVDGADGGYTKAAEMLKSKSMGNTNRKFFS